MNRQAKATSDIGRMAEFSSVGRTVIVDMPTTVSLLDLDRRHTCRLPTACFDSQLIRLMKNCLGCVK